MKFPRLENIEFSKIRQIYAHADNDSIDLGIGKPFCNTPDNIKKAGLSAIEKNFTAYTETAGIYELRQAVAEQFRKRKGIKVVADNVLITCGVAEAVFVSMFSMLQKGDEVLVPDPGYPAYAAIAGMTDSRPVPYPLYRKNRFGAAAGDIIPLINPKTRIIILNSPSNPTGGITDSRELKKIGGYIADRDICVISDEVYTQLNFSGNAVSSISDFSSLDRVMILSGVSKEFSMTGWRLGWIISSEDNIKELSKTHLFMVSCACSISQKAAVEAVSSESDQVKKILSLNRELMADGLKVVSDIEYMIPDAGLFVFVDVSRYGSGDKIAQRILKEVNVVTIPGSGFGEKGRDFIRLSFGAQAKDINEGLLRLKDFFKRL